MASPEEARRIFLLLTFTRWFPVGLVVALLTLFQLERGQSVAQALTASAASGVVVFLLELPTSSFADVLGRRPVYVAAATVNVLAAVTYLLADSFWTFTLAAALTGAFRVLDSGPLEAWYVDTVHLSRPGADVDRTLAAQGAVLGGSIAAGAVVSGVLVWWHPLTSVSALVLPVVCFAVLNVVHLVAVLLVLREPRPRGRSAGRVLAAVRTAPAVARDGLLLLGTSRVLRGLVVVEVFWGLAMTVFEQLQPIRLAELLGSEAEAAAVMGPVAAVGWAVFAAGAMVAGLAARRLGVVRTAIVARVLNGVGAVAMGLVLGPGWLVLAYLGTYALHGGAGPMHAALLHREASARNRATVLSINSMVAFAAMSVTGPLLGLLATRGSVQAAMVVGGGLSVLGAVCYLPALRAERTRSATPVRRG